jgi:hypothetical protein
MFRFTVTFVREPWTGRDADQLPLVLLTTVPVNVTVNVNVNAPQSVQRLRELARIMDAAVRVPGTRVRVGLDALIGLIPGLGDVAGGLTTSYTILEARRLGAPGSVLVRMVWNILIDAVVGTVPLLGDLFDIGYKANIRNVQLLERFLAYPGPTRRASRALVALLLALVALIVAGSLVLTFLIVRGLARALF